MRTRQSAGWGIVLALGLAAHPVLAQRGGDGSSAPARPQPSQADPDTVALVQMVDAAIVSTPEAQNGDRIQGDLPLKWEAAHFIKGQNGVYIPFTIAFDPAMVKTSEIAVYIRAVERGQLPAVAGALASPARGGKSAPPPAPRYAWDNVHFLRKPADGRITRAIAVAPGDYDLMVAVKERSTAGGGPATPAGTSGLLRHSLSAPDFSKTDLQTSSVILASAVEPVGTQLTPAEQEANPYVFGPMRIVPSRSGQFAKGNELQVIFWVYGATAPGGKPDVSIDYNFYSRQPDGAEKYFNKTVPQQLNASTLPPDFNAGAGHQLPGSLVVSLMPFPAGSYRLEIKVTDKPSGKMVTQNVTFTVTG